MVVENRRKSDSDGARGEKSQSPENKGYCGEHRVQISELRRRWELATVLDFLTVFEELIGKDSKISAEEIEQGLISPNSLLAKLHITLLKGIPPLSKALDGSDAWVTVLCKKLEPWWPWVAEGDIPLKAAKGEEISGYKELGPTKRLLLLRALCEIRADQADAVAYINDALKQGSQISSFRKDEIAGDQNGTSFWYEGNKLVGPRLYRGVSAYDKNEEYEGRECFNPPSFEWETVATNLEEFRKVVDDFSASKVVAETVVCRTVETEVIPALEKLQKKIERAEKKKQRELMLNDRRPFYAERATRSCRSLRLVNYSYDDYDRVMMEAIRLTSKETELEQRQKNEDGESGRRVSAATNRFVDRLTNQEDGSRKRVFSEEDAKAMNGVIIQDVGKANKTIDGDIIQDVGSDDNDSSYRGEGVVSDSDFSDSGDSKTNKQARLNGPRHFGVRWSTRLTRGASQSFVDNRNLGAKNRLRQRPILNSALVDTIVVPDSEDES